MFAPSGFMIEYGWSGRDIDMDDWCAEKMDCGPGSGEHDRKWLEEATRRQGLKAKGAVTRGRCVETSGESE